jgi:hypothetical protein
MELLLTAKTHAQKQVEVSRIDLAVWLSRFDLKD